MSDDTPRDRLIAAGACLALAAMCAGIALWLGLGIEAGQKDFERFSTGTHAMNVRTQRDVAAYTIMLMVLAGAAGTAALGFAGLAVWMVAAGRGRT